MLSQKRERPPRKATADAVEPAVKGPVMFDSGAIVTQLDNVELIVRHGGRVLCMTTTRAVRTHAGLDIEGLRIPAAVLP